MKLNAPELRQADEKELRKKLKDIKRIPLYFILENIYDTYNIGGIFRLADALNVAEIFLCGEMEIPPNHKIKKASIGTYKIVPWKYCKTAREAIEKVKDIKNNGNVTIMAVEQSSDSIPYTKADYRLPLALIFGNETFGVTPETLKLADKTVEIPMWGINKSLNVIVSAAIVGYEAINQGSR